MEDKNFGDLKNNKLLQKALKIKQQEKNSGEMQYGGNYGRKSSISMNEQDSGQSIDGSDEDSYGDDEGQYGDDNTSISQSGQKHKHKRRSKNDNQGRDFRCGCGKRYLSYPALYTHIKTKHDGVTPKGTNTSQFQTGRGRGRPRKIIVDAEKNEERRKQIEGSIMDTMMMPSKLKGPFSQIE